MGQCLVFLIPTRGCPEKMGWLMQKTSRKIANQHGAAMGVAPPGRCSLEVLKAAFDSSTFSLASQDFREAGTSRRARRGGMRPGRPLRSRGRWISEFSPTIHGVITNFGPPDWPECVGPILCWLYEKDLPAMSLEVMVRGDNYPPTKRHCELLIASQEW